MKRMWMSMVVLALASGVVMGQKIDDTRMSRDIEVAENVLQTLIKQQFESQRTFFPLEITGSYQEGYGVTFRLPAEYTTPLVFLNSNGQMSSWGSNGVVTGYRYSTNGSTDPIIIENGREVRVRGDRNSYTIAPSDKNSDEEIRLREKRELSLDSIRDVYNTQVITAAKTFIADYGDMISQLGANEKIVVTNQGDQPKMWVGRIVSAPNRTLLSIESNKSDIVQYKQGKITRDQLLKKMKVVDTEVTSEVEPDFELLASIFNRLYRQDLSTTYFADGASYERLKDFGVVFYMSVFSSDGSSPNGLAMPTINATGLSQEERDQKATELYPKFENEFKDNIIEYGRTAKSLKPDESLVFNIKLTKCVGCGIPQSLELSIKGSVLNDYNAGKIDKKAAVSKIIVKKGAAQ